MAQLKEEEELKPFGGYVQPQKTIGISLKSTVGNEKTEKHGYNVFLDTEYIFKKFNQTDQNGQVVEISKKVEPSDGEELKLALARRLYKTGISLNELTRMELIENSSEIKNQDDFEEIKKFHLHSAIRKPELKPELKPE